MSWPQVTLGEVARIARSGIGPGEIASGTTYVGLEHIDGSGAFVEVPTVEAGELGSTKFRFSAQHILFGKLRPYLKKTARPDFEGVCSTDILPLEPTKDVDRDYLYHALRRQSFVAEVTSLCSGANLPRISPKVLASMMIPLPGIDEQRRIAAILDKADALRAKRREAIAKLDQLLQSVFLDMFGDPVRNSREWPEAQTLGDVADIVSGITKGRKVRAATREVPYLAVSNVHDRVLKLDVVKLIEAADDEISRYSLRPNDLLLTEGGDPDKLGRGALWNGELPECIHQNHIFRVRLTSDALHPVYLSWLVGSERGKRYFAKQAKQTTGIASINMRQLRGFPLLVPPMNLQRRFAEVTRQVEKQRQRIERHRDQFDILLASLQHRAFTGTL